MNAVRKRRITTNIVSVWVLSFFLFGCNGGSHNNSDAEAQSTFSDWNRNIKITDLVLNVNQRSGKAVITIDGSLESNGVSLEIGDLLINKIMINGHEVRYSVDGERLDIEVPRIAQEIEIAIDYTFVFHEAFNGLSADGYSFSWPYYCGNIFPCRSSPDQGSQYSLQIEGLPEGLQAIYPESISMDAPAYMLGYSIGNYNYLNLGTTNNGIEVGIYYRAQEYDSVLLGTQDLRQIINWYEQNIGDYLFGDRMASVSLAWSDGGYGGMEHHPYWHINSQHISDPAVHAHEAAHGWFGNGVRIACWEEFVLSEGVASYLTARVIEEVVGEEEGQAIWNDYSVKLDNLQNSDNNKIAWPDGCGELDIIEDDLYGMAAYMKGAFFLKNVEAVIGKDMLDNALKLFYTNNKGKSARFDDLLKVIEAESGFNPVQCAHDWLKSESVPEQSSCHANTSLPVL